MKNIKVNILNGDGIRSSTTINISICEAYYKVAAGLSGLMPHTDIIADCHASTDDYLKGVTYCAQSYVNCLCARAVADGYKGVSKYFIESNMIDAVINNQGL